jgi:pimeloyl-ACP methyl ester carboxylesterase
MQQFQPPGFGQRTVNTSLGTMAYYTQVGDPWRSPPSSPSSSPSPSSPPLLFLHSLGGGSSAYEWSKVYPAFAADYQIIAPDLIGWGQSPHPQRDYRPSDYLVMIRELIEGTTSQPVTVFASSLTAAYAIRIACQHPHLFKQLILVSPSGYSDFGADYARGFAAQLAKVPLLDQAIYALGAANEAAVENFLTQFLFAQPARISDEIIAAYLASALQPNAEYSALASLRGDLFFDLALYLDRLTVPTVFLWGSDSRFGKPDRGRRLQKLNPKAIHGFHEIPDTGVLPHLEMPEIVIGLAQKYL